MSVVSTQIEVITIEQLLTSSDFIQKKLHKELEEVFARVFPKIEPNSLEDLLQLHFSCTNNNLRRYLFLVRNETGTLIATTLFDQGDVTYEDRVLQGNYTILITVLPEYQGKGLGKAMAIKIFQDFRPDVLMITFCQAAALHTWGDLIAKGLLTGYEVYPRIEHYHGKDVLITIPYKELDFVIRIFEQLYLGVLHGHAEHLPMEMNKFTIKMVRKDSQEDWYDFEPWIPHGRVDYFAKALGAVRKDGIVMMFRKL